MNERLIIVGCGISAISAVKAIREINPDAEVHIFGSEKYYAYNRIKLSKKLFDNIDEDSVLLQKKDWYQTNKVNVHLDSEVTGIDTENQEIILSDNSRVAYDKLLLANGAINTVPPIAGIDSPGVYTLRELDDALNVHKNLNDKKEIINIGAGSQGLETVWVLRQNGKNVTIVQRNRRLMPRELDERSSSLLTSTIENLDIPVLLSTQIIGIEGKDRIECQLNNSSKLMCDMVIYSAGISPNIELLTNTPVKVNKGVVVDRNMKTNIENIFAAGDIAEFEGRVAGLWNIAIEQGKTAGYNMVGKNVTYEHIVPVTTLNAFGISLFSMGKVEDSENINSITTEDDSNKTYKRLFIEDQKIVGAIVFGDTKKSPIIKAAIEHEVLLESLDLTKLSVDEILEYLKMRR